MPHEVKWVIENYLLMNKYTDTLDMTDFLSVTEKNIAFLSGVQNTIHIISDLTELKGVHPGFGRIPELFSLSHSFMSQANLGSIVAYGTDNKLVKFLATIIMQLNNIEWRVVASSDDAIRYFIHIDPSLSPQLETLLSTPTDD